MVNTKKNKLKEIKGFREILGILIITFGFLILLGLISYNPSEIGLLTNTTSSHNWIGLFGAYFSFILLLWFGVASYIVPLCIMIIGISSIFWSSSKIYQRLLWFFLALFCLSGLVDMSAHIWMSFVDKFQTGTPGGLIGNMLAYRTIGLIIGKTGSAIIFLVLFIISIARMIDIPVIIMMQKLFIWIKDSKIKDIFYAIKEKFKRSKGFIPNKKSKTEVENLFLDPQATKNILDEKAKPIVKEKPKPNGKLKDKPKKSSKNENDDLEVIIPKNTNSSGLIYQKPSIDLLDPSVKQEKVMTATQVNETAKILQNALEEFGVEAKVTGVQQGPVVTCYEILPSAGVRVERIKSLADNIALKMHAKSIRIQAPIPGKGVCGVEVPNIARSGVFFRDILEEADFSSEKYELPLILGKDVSGKSLILDLAKMPHMLIAGATGAGKSVCMNTILTGLLMKYSPEDLRLMLVDPKTVEFHTYNDLPHLVVPVITNAKKVSLGLRWVIDEMERRFRYFNQAGVRDLSGYNNRVILTQEELFEDQISVKENEQNKEIIPDHLPYIVVVIDELADLMSVAQAEIEVSIARLAAKSRAAGIHMILATQRPDVKVITGTIKANFPARVAFKVSQKVDSRTILDRMGADALLGKGDMLVLPPGSDKLIRIQGAFTSDGEIEKVSSFWKDQSKPDFIKEIKEKIEKPVVDLPEIDDSGDEEMVEQALEVIRQSKRASTSSLQRRLRIGYTRAARIMDLLEEKGIIGPPDGAGPREILIDLDGEIPQNTEIDNEADTT
tara:strand:- start:2109 stop:4457 length:2349 start_codon:yes stop_codon:yes gene_type:complete